MTSLDEARAAQISWDEWCLRVSKGGYRYTTTHWYKAGRALEAEAKVVPPPPPSTLSLQRTIFWANVTDDAVQHACRLGNTWRHALTADPTYAPTLGQVNALKAASAGVDCWGNQTEISFVTISNFRHAWGLDRSILQAETANEYLSATSMGRLIGNPNAWTSGQRASATAKISQDMLAVTGECYDGRPDTYSAQGVPISSITLGVAMDNGLRYALGPLLALTPASARSTVCIWHGAGLLPEEWDLLKAL